MAVNLHLNRKLVVLFLVLRYAGGEFLQFLIESYYAGCLSLVYSFYTTSFSALPSPHRQCTSLMKPSRINWAGSVTHA
jgi:hypothetical protein